MLELFIGCLVALILSAAVILWMTSAKRISYPDDKDPSAASRKARKARGEKASR